MPTQPKATRREERGSLTLETVILWPAVFVLIFGLIHAGLWFHTRNVALAAAQEGARTASVNEGRGGADRAGEFMATAGESPIIREARVGQVLNGRMVTVTVTASAVTLVPGWRVDVKQSSSAPIKRWTSP